MDNAPQKKPSKTPHYSLFYALTGRAATEEDRQEQQDYLETLAKGLKEEQAQLKEQQDNTGSNGD